MVPAKRMNLFLLSTAVHWAVLIKPNGWYGCEELKSRSIQRVLDATNFADRKRSSRVGAEGPFTLQKHITALHSLQISQDTPGFREISKS